MIRELNYSIVWSEEKINIDNVISFSHETTMFLSTEIKKKKKNLQISVLISCKVRKTLTIFACTILSFFLRKKGCFVMVVPELVNVTTRIF